MAERLGGRRLVVSLYAILVAVAGVMGLILGLISPRDLDPQFLGVVPFPPTPLGMAAYGALTVALVLGVALLVVVVVSRYDDEAI